MSRRWLHIGNGVTISRGREDLVIIMMMVPAQTSAKVRPRRFVIEMIDYSWLDHICVSVSVVTIYFVDWILAVGLIIFANRITICCLVEPSI